MMTLTASQNRLEWGVHSMPDRSAPAIRLLVFPGRGRSTREPGRRKGNQVTSAAGPGIPGFEIVKVLDNAQQTVFRARNTASGDDVVIKLLDRAKEPILPARFDRSRRTLVRLSALDVGFVPLLDHGVAPAGNDFIVVPYYATGSLQDQVDQGPMPWAMAARLMADVAEIVGRAHAESVVLGDVRPSTILLRAVGDPMVAAMGMATRRFDDGTPDFTAPEADGGRKRLTPASDVYSLALVLGALVAGEAKKRGQTDEDYLELLRPLMPSRFLDVVEHGLAGSHTNRYRDARTMERALRAATEADPDEPGPPEVAEGTEPFELDEILIDLDQPADDSAESSAVDSLPPGLEDIVFVPRQEAPAELEEHHLLPAGLEDLTLAPSCSEPGQATDVPAGVAAAEAVLDRVAADETLTDGPRIDEPVADGATADGPFLDHGVTDGRVTDQATGEVVVDHEIDHEAEVGVEVGAGVEASDESTSAEGDADRPSPLDGPATPAHAGQPREVAAGHGELLQAVTGTVDLDIEIDRDGNIVLDPGNDGGHAPGDDQLDLTVGGSDQTDATTVLELGSLDVADQPGHGPVVSGEGVPVSDARPRQQPAQEAAGADGEGDGRRWAMPALDAAAIVVDLDELGSAGHRKPSALDLETTNETANETTKETATSTAPEADDADIVLGNVVDGSDGAPAPIPPTLPTERSIDHHASVVFADDQTDVFGDGDQWSDDELDEPEWVPYPDRRREAMPTAATALAGAGAGAVVDPTTPTFAGNGLADQEIPFTGVTRHRHSAEPLTWLDKTRVAAELAWFRSRRSMASLAAVLGLLAIAGIAVYFVAREISSTETEAEGVPLSPTTETSSPKYVATDAPFVTDPPQTQTTTTTTTTTAAPRRRAATAATARTTTPAPAPPATVRPPETSTTSGTGGTGEVLPPTKPPSSTANPPPTTGPPATTQSTAPAQTATASRRGRQTTAPTQTAPPSDDDEAAGGGGNDAVAVQDVQSAVARVPSILTLEVVDLGRRSAAIRYTSDQCVATRFVLSGGGATRRGSSPGFDVENRCSTVWNLDFTGPWALRPASTYTLEVVVKGQSDQLTDRSRITFTTDG